MSVLVPSGQVYYQSGDIRLARDALAIGDKIYLLQDVRSLDVVSASPGPRFLSTLAFAPGYFLFAGYLVLSQEDDSRFWMFVRIFVVAVAMCVLGAGIIAGLRLRKTKLSTRYFIRLNGKSVIYVSLDEDYAQWLVRQALRVKNGADTVEGPPNADVPEDYAGEPFYYSTGQATVTNEHVVLGRQHFATQDIRKAHVIQVNPEQYNWRFGLALTLMFIGNTISRLRSDARDAGHDISIFFLEDVSYLPMILPLIGIVLIFWATMAMDRATHIVNLRGKFGDFEWVEAFGTLNRDYAKVLATNINRAIKSHKSQVQAGNTAMQS